MATLHSANDSDEPPARDNTSGTRGDLLSAPWSVRLLRHVGRALRWRCPLCGVRPVFSPVSRVRSFQDWLHPLDGCPRCGYAYEREPGYFLLATWAINYAGSAFFAMAFFVTLRLVGEVPFFPAMIATIVGVTVVSVAMVRHSKCLFLAMDLFFDPHRRRGQRSER